MRELALCFVWPFMSRTEERGLYSGHSDKLGEEREEQYVALSLSFWRGGEERGRSKREGSLALICQYEERKDSEKRKTVVGFSFPERVLIIALF